MPAIAGLKAELGRFDFAGAGSCFESALKCSTVGEVRALLDKFSVRHPLPLLAPELIVVEADAVTKEEAIKRRSGSAMRAWPERGTARPGKSHLAARGDLLHGVRPRLCHAALPSDAVSANSLVLLKFAEPIPWNSVDEKPVRVMILSAIREGDAATEHLKIMSALARQLMHEEFRAALERKMNPAALCQLVRSAN